MSAALNILDPGLSTTLQDLGRSGYQRFGIPTSGALDTISLKLANRLVGNDEKVGALECSYLGPSFVVEADEIRIAFVGGHARIRAHEGLHDGTGRLLPMNQSMVLQRGTQVSVGSIRDASTLDIALEGVFDIEPTLGSQSTFLRGAIGGLDGRRLRSGDLLPLCRNEVETREDLQLGNQLESRTELRILRGPQAHYFNDREIKHLCAATFTIGSGSDRTGMRLDGIALAHERDFNITSDAVVHGSIQVPGDGKPIVLLADRQTTGGYPKIATIISADLPCAGRLAIGARVTFRLVDIAEAEAARRDARQTFQALVDSIHPVAAEAPLAERLMSGNLVSGVVNGCA